MNTFKKLTAAAAVASVALISACGSNDDEEPRALDNGSSETETVEETSLETFGDLDEEDRNAADELISTASLHVCPGNNSLYIVNPNGGSMVPEGYQINNFVDDYEIDDATKSKLLSYSDSMMNSALLGAGRIDAPNTTDYDYTRSGCSGDPDIDTVGGSGTDLEDFFTVSEDEKKLTLAFDKVRIIDLRKSPNPHDFTVGGHDYSTGVNDEDFESLRGGHARAEFVLDLENNTLEMTDDSWLQQVM